MRATTCAEASIVPAAAPRATRVRGTRPHADTRRTPPRRRVVAVDRDRLVLTDGSAPFSARLSGSFVFHQPDPAQWPCVGDWVLVARGGRDDGEGLIQAVLHILQHAFMFPPPDAPLRAGRALRFQLAALAM